MSFGSYYLKTIFFWALERIPCSQWTSDKHAFRVLDLLDDLIYQLAEKHLPHYFIPELNLFENIAENDYKTIVQEIVCVREQPLRKYEVQI